MDEHKLLEFNRIGPNFTFSNGHDRTTWSRLDHFVANPQWIEIFGDHTESIKGFYKSDHRLLVLEETSGGIEANPF